jgi:malonyl-CoA/methylmalonyl-CoA synthetase
MSGLLQRLLDPGRGEVPAVDAPEGGRTGGLSHRQLRSRVLALARHLAPAGDLAGAPIAFLYPPGARYVEVLLAIMAAGGLAVPLSPLHTGPELEALLASAAPTRLLCHPDLRGRLPAELEALGLGDGPGDPDPPAASGSDAGPFGPVDDRRDALMLFTSGTTGRPKGVVSSHAALAACCAALHEAWGWRADDRLLHVLPLHHTHGVVVALLGALWAGARVRFAPFEPLAVWDLLGEATVFMAVPTIHARLLEAFAAAPPAQQARFRQGAAGLRLVTSGSAALPPSVLQAFEAATGHRLLERYGMTEIGMALSNPLAGPRLAGTVGRELPGVEVDLVDDDGRPCPTGQPGELRVRSPQMFTRYQGDPAATGAAFDAQGRFITGDTGLREPSGWVRLLGRTSVDVLKSGGYKLSALEIEEVLRGHPGVADVAVIGQPDEVWGDRVTACVVPRPGAALTLAELQTFARSRLAPYKLPRALRLLPALPRNAMGKVQKTRLG